MDDRQAKAVMQSLKSTASFLGKESEYLTFEEYVTWSEKVEPSQALNRLRPHSSNLYVLGLDHEISMLEEIVFAINATKLNHYSVSDEMISKMFCSG